MDKLNLHVKRVLYLFIGALLLSSCQKSALEEYYEQPSGVGANIWESLQEEGRFSLFLEAVEKLEQEKSLQFSLITVLAPPDDVFNKFLTENSYGSIDDIPVDVLKYIIEFHLIDWPHAEGMVTEDSKLFKRKTRSSAPNFVEVDDEGVETHYVNYNKYMQFFYDEFFEQYDGNASVDYKLLTGNEFKKFHVYDAEVTVADRRFSNGWVHEVDKVLVPPVTLDEWLADRPEYSVIYSLLNRFASVQQDGSGVSHGDDIDGNKLYCKANELYPKINWAKGFWPTYDPIGIGSDNEAGGAHAPTMLLRNNLSFIAYSNDAMMQYLDTHYSLYKERYQVDNYYDSIPRQIVREILFPLAYEDVVLPSNIIDGTQLNNELEYINIDITASDAEIGLCSNAMVYGVNEYQLPRYIQGVSKPIFTDPDYSYFAIALQKLGILAPIRDAELQFTVFAPSNDVFEVDSIKYDEIWNSVGSLEVRFYREGEEILTPELTDLISSHILIGDIEPTTETNFYICYGGWYVALNSEGVWSGGNDTIPSLGQKIGAPVVDNGSFYPIDNFVIKNGNSIGAEIYTRPEFSEFKAICEQLDMFDAESKAMNFILYPYVYTAFIPSNEQMIAMANEIPTDPTELEKFIKYHFVRGNIFSNGEVTGQVQTAFLNEEETTDYLDVYFEVDVINSLGSLSVQGINNTAPVPTVQGTGSNMICSDGVIQILNGVLKY